MAELTYEELEELITVISSGKKIIYIEEIKDIFIFKYPSNDSKLIADSIYHKYYNLAIEDGLMPIAEVEKLIMDRGVFTEEDESKIEKLKGQLKAQQVLLSKTLKVKANQDRIKKTMQGLTSQINEILHKKHSKLVMSADTKATEEKNSYLCWACTFNINDKRIWETFDEFSDSRETIKQSFIMSYFLNFVNGLEIETVRYMARSTMWRIRYNNSIKTGEALFGVPSAKYSNDQLSLVYWSSFYDQVYQMMPEDRPSDDTISDDKELDSYMEDYYKELTKKTQEARQKKKYGDKLSAFDAQEVIVTRSHELYEEIEYDKPREAKRHKDAVDLKNKQKSKQQRIKNSIVTVDKGGSAKVLR